MRILRTSPVFSLVVISVLALGIGANTAMFSIIDKVLLHPFPFPALNRLVEINGFTAAGRQTGLSSGELDFLAANVHALERVGFSRWQNLVLTGVDNTDYVHALQVSSSAFDILGARAKLGRTFLPAEFESSAPPVAIIGDKLWHQHFAADPGILGRQILLDGKGYTVVGVMGPEFVFSTPFHQVWIPYHQGDNMGEALSHGLNTLARMRPGNSLQQAQRELDSVTPALPPDPNRAAGWHARLRPLTESYVGEYRSALYILWGAVGLVLLIACANAANLLLARASQRRREIAVRASLGASGMRLAGLVLTETLTLGVSAAIAGVFLAMGFLRLLVALFPTHLPLPQLDRVSIHVPALAVAMGLALLTTLVSGIPSCLSLLRPDLGLALGGASRYASAGRGANRTRSTMIALEVALSLTLLAGAGLMLRTLNRLLDVKLGFQPKQVLTAGIAVPPQLDKEAMAAHYSRMLDGVRSIPGVQGAGIVTVLPLGELVATTSFTAEGVDSPQDHSGPGATYFREISPGYFAALGTRLLRGRDFNAADSAQAPSVVIIDDELARRYWPGQDPIGKRISRSPHPKPGEWATVVGEVESTKHRSLRTGADAELYIPYTQQMVGAKFTHLVVRAQGDPLSIAAGLRSRIHALDPTQPVTDVKTMQTLVEDSAGEERFHTILLETFAILALGLAVAGIFAVVSYHVAQRAREIGIRSALGATPGDVMRFVLGIAMRPVTAGACAGLAGGLAAARLLRSQLFETPPADPLTFGAVLAILIAAAVASAAWPAWRASRIDPARVLHAE